MNNLSWRRSTVLVLASLSFTTISCSDFFKSDSANNNNGNVGQTTPQDPQKPQDGATLPDVFTDPNLGAFTEEKMLVNIGVNVLARSADNLASQVPVLKNSLRQYCEALEGGQNARREETQAKQDWQRAMLAFHELEAAPFGPLLDDGRALNDFIYSWPYLNTCGIDNKVFENSKNPQTVEALVFNLRGLGAIEYLLFENTLNSSCNPRSNRHMAEWNARTEVQKKTDRCVWAQKLVNDLETKTQVLKSKWAVKEGNFTLNLINGQRYASPKVAVNALTDAMSHIEILKDAKLGRPLARHKDCAADKCPEDVEHKYSGFSLASAEAQLLGFRAIFTGSFAANSTAFGFDDSLIQAGRQDVAQKLVTALDRAILSVQKAQDNGPLKEQIEALTPASCKASTMTDRQVEICAVHADVREVAFLFKTEVLAALALKAPPTHQGDND